ncbi:MAG TPA: hypothetical protein VGO57_11370 [Verrucomicrobiae bacterium]|jgi:hypothetical protein
MSEADVIWVIRKHVEGLFPKTCNVCQRVFPDYQNYLQNTTHRGVPISYDLALGDLRPKHSSGNIALANCGCGNTLTISSAGMPLMRIWQILYWVKMESLRRGVKIEDMICYIRETVENQALNEPVLR